MQSFNGLPARLSRPCQSSQLMRFAMKLILTEDDGTVIDSWHSDLDDENLWWHGDVFEAVMKTQTPASPAYEAIHRQLAEAAQAFKKFEN